MIFMRWGSWELLQVIEGGQVSRGALIKAGDAPFSASAFSQAATLYHI